MTTISGAEPARPVHLDEHHQQRLAQLRKIEESERRARTNQSFWSVVVGVPAIISVFRLVVEAGGELQTSLLLVANVNPVNLVTAFAITSARMVSALLVLLFAVSAVLAASVDPALRGPDRDARPLVVRWKTAAPMWFVIVVIVVALATWQLLYLPLLLLAVVAMFQLGPARLSPRPIIRILVVCAFLVGYAWLIGPTVADAMALGEYLVIALLVAPVVLALGVTGPIHPIAVRPLAVFAPLIMLGVMLWTAYSVVTTPILPTTVTTIDAPAEPGQPVFGSSRARTEDIRGHVISVDDLYAAILQEHGGVRYVPLDDVRAQVLCPSEEELPRYRLWVHGFHIEDSIFEGLGRRERPAADIEAACRTIPQPRHTSPGSSG